MSSSITDDNNINENVSSSMIDNRVLALTIDNISSSMIDNRVSALTIDNISSPVICSGVFALTSDKFVVPLSNGIMKRSKFLYNCFSCDMKESRGKVVSLDISSDLLKEVEGFIVETEKFMSEIKNKTYSEIADIMAVLDYLDIDGTFDDSNRKLLNYKTSYFGIGNGYNNTAYKQIIVENNHIYLTDEMTRIFEMSIDENYNLRFISSQPGNLISIHNDSLITLQIEQLYFGKTKIANIYNYRSASCLYGYGDDIYVGSLNHGIDIVNFITKEEYHIPIHIIYIMCIFVNEKYIFIGSHYGDIQIYDRITKKLIHHIKKENYSINTIEQYGDKIVFSNLKHVITLKIDTWEENIIIKHASIFKFQIYKDYIIIGTTVGEILIFSLIDNCLLQQCRLTNNPVRNIYVDNDIIYIIYCLEARIDIYKFNHKKINLMQYKIKYELN